MFGKKQYKKRSSNIVIVIFRLILSLVMFAVLLGGTYAAYKHFSGLDPLKLNPQALLAQFLAGKIPQEFSNFFSSNQIAESLSKQVNTQVLGKQKAKDTLASIAPQVIQNETNANLLFKFMMVSDSHSDNGNLEKALTQSKANYPDLKFVIGLGDYSQVGTVSELKKAKNKFDNGSLRYFLIPGDHDLWDCRNRNLPPADCFKQVFGPDYQAFSFENFKFMLLDNSDNYLGFDQKQLDWISLELEKTKEDPNLKGIFVFLHEPFFHPSSDHIMGKEEAKLKSQAQTLMFQLKSFGIKRIFAGDVHYFSEYQEPQNKLEMVTVGAAGIERNPQAPRFAVVSVFEDGFTKVEDIEIK